MSDGLQTPVSGAWTTERSASTDRYERLGLLGEGGMGSVWRARDRALNRDVAYKTVSLNAPQDVRDRLIQEARIAANLAGTGCVAVFDHGTAADGRPYYTMEMLTFPAFAGERSQALRQLLDVATTLGAAHARGIVHRDVKPSNVGLAGERAVLADWGLARPVEMVGEWDQSILTQARPRTTTGLAMGTAGYMAPEQLTGAPASVRADVWSLGAMLYDVVCEERVEQRGSHTLMAAVVAGTVTLPKTALGRLAQSALSVDPNRRPQDAAAFAEQLRDCIQPQAKRASVRLLGAGVAAALALGLFSGWMSVPDFRVQASDATTSLAWSYVDSGRLDEARTLGMQADTDWSTPDSRGLLTLPVSAPVEPTAHPQDCPEWVLDDQQAYAACVRPGMISLYSADGAMRWEVAAAEAYGVRASGGLVSFSDTFANIRVALDGSTARMAYSATERLAPVGDDWFVQTSDLLRRVHADGSGYVDIARGVDQLVGAVDDFAVSTDGGQLVLHDGLSNPSVFVGQLIVSMHVGADTVRVVGERGLVVELDRRTWAERRRYSLPGRGEVLAAAIGPLGHVVWSTRRGVLRAVNGVVTDQLSTTPASMLSVDEHDRVWGVTDGNVWQWRAHDEARHVYEPFRTSTTSLARRGPYLMVGTDDGRLITVNPRTGEARATQLDGESVRDIFSTEVGVYSVVGGSLVLTGANPASYPRMASAALLGDGTIIGVGRWGPGVSWLTNGVRHEELDTEVFRSIQADHSGESAIARTKQGELWRISPDRQMAPLGVGDVSAFASCEAGLVVGRGSTVSIPGGGEVDVGDGVTAVQCDRDLIAVGTRLGSLWILAHDLEILAHMQAHGERVSALTFFGDDLFSGSWESGVRRWQLGALRP